jgi:hypothetical protein
MIVLRAMAVLTPFEITAMALKMVALRSQLRDA